MSANDPRYADVNDGFIYPAITREQAAAALKAIIGRFGRLEDASAVRTRRMGTTPGSSNIVRFWTDGKGYRRVWISRKPCAGVDKGWGRLIHDAAHMVFRYRHPSWRPHAPGHEKLEYEIAQYARAELIGRTA